MRLRRLDLTRYGKFTDYSIDFGERRADWPDLHIIYGPNEAGKSTALAGFLDLLYGIESRSRFNFLHPYTAMRIGASLETGDTVQELVRVKRAQNSLLDGNGLPIGEALLGGQLGGIDRESYRAMFSLDDETLEAGGESILASKGDLGQLLFSASTGLAELSRTLNALRAEADGFYRYHAHGGELAALKARLAALKEERERTDIVAARYAQLIETRDRARLHYDEAIAARAAMQARMDAIQRRVGALPRLAALRTAREQLRPLEDLPEPPAEWRGALPDLQKEEITLSVQAAALDRDLAQTSADLAAITVDESALAIADQVDRLGGLHARYVTADTDIPDRRQQVHDEELAIAGILARLGRGEEADPHRLLLDAATVGALQDLITQRSGIDASLQAATRELADARHRCREAEARLQQADAGTGAALDDARIAALAAALAAVRGDGHAAERRVAKRARDTLLQELADRLLALHPWEGDVDRLAALPIPASGDVQCWKTALATAQNQHEHFANQVERCRSEQLRLAAERDAARLAGLVSDQDVAETRAVREAAWANHRRALDATSADVFETALRRDDIVMTARLQHEAESARLQQTTQSLAMAEAASVHADQALAAAAAKLQSVRNEIAAAVSMVLPPTTTIFRFEAWIEQRAQVLETRTRLRQAERDLREAEAGAADARSRLQAALAASGVPHAADATLDALRANAQAVLDRATDLKALRAALAERRHEVETRDRALTAVAEADQTWRAAWAATCAGCWLGDAGAPPALATVRQVLAALAELGPALDRRASLLHRIAQMQDDQLAFATAVTAIAATLGLPSDTPLALAHRISANVQAAQAARAQRAGLAKQLDGVRGWQRKLAEARAIHNRRQDLMTAFFAVGTLTEVAGKLSDSEKRAALQTQADAAEREIMEALRTTSIAEAETALDSADRPALEAEFAELKARVDDQDQRTHALFHAHATAADQVEAVGGDAAVARIEEQRRTILLQIEDGALRYLKLRLGIVAAEQALHAYRAQHRSAMMQQASEAFRTISRDAYAGLASQPNKDGELLIATAADGSSKIASELSKGTRFQLYLALRVAGYHEFARMRSPVPFIADDIMETFDDFRAEEALRLLADMAQAGQVIYLTHHRHLCDIALRTCPGVRVHELGLIAA